MTIKDLYRLNDLRKLIAKTKRKIAQVEASLDAAGVNYSAMPRNRSSKNSISDRNNRLIDLRDTLKAQESDYIAQLIEIERFILNIDDYHVKLIVSLHFVDGLTWMQTAQRIGGNTEDSVRKACERYIEEYNKKH